MFSIKQLRVDKNLSQEDVAKYLGISKNQFSKKERGEVEFKVSEVLKMCELFDTKFNDIRFN